MDIREISDRINEHSRLLADGNIREIERDILLQDLRSLYLLVKGSAPVKEQAIEQAVPVVIASKPIQEEVVVVPVPELKPAPVVEDTVSKEEQVILFAQKEPEPVVVPEPVRNEEPKSKAGSLNDIFAGEERSLNERLSGDKKPALNDQAARKDLKSMIDFNKQYVLTNELFKGDSQAFHAAIARINNSPTIESAFEYIKTDLLPRYNWSKEMQSARLFDKLVRQKFGL